MSSAASGTSQEAALGEGGTRTPVLLIRHGQTPWNVAGIWQGQADVGLTEEGEQQARAVAADLASQSTRPWKRICASDLQRARRTAETIGEALGLEVETDPRMRERDAGKWSGHTKAEIEKTDAETLAAFREGDPDVRPGGVGETTHEVRARALAALADLVSRAPGEPAILVSHLGWIRTLVPDANADNGGCTEVIAEEVLRQWEGSASINQANARSGDANSIL